MNPGYTNNNVLINSSYYLGFIGKKYLSLNFVIVRYITNRKTVKLGTELSVFFFSFEH